MGYLICNKGIFQWGSTADMDAILMYGMIGAISLCQVWFMTCLGLVLSNLICDNHHPRTGNPVLNHSVNDHSAAEHDLLMDDLPMNNSSFP